jgi:N-acetylglucosaminyl-diphospho-decaprenol L-rhamnosyltransferase
MSDVDVIVLDVDGGSMLEECHDSIQHQTVQAARVIVFDNGSRARSLLHTHRSEKNLGFAGGANAAYKLTSAPYVALVNNDVILQADWIAHVRDALDRDPKLAAVQTIIRRPDGRIDGAGIDISDGTFRQIGHGMLVGTPLAVAWGVSATATLYRRESLGAQIFDERFFAYYEDVELSARLRAQGWRVAVLPEVKAVHRGSQSAKVLRGGALRLRTRNRYFVARMHPGIGSIRALLWEDARLALRGKTSPRGLIEGLCSTL